MEKNSKKIGISRNTAINLIYAVAIFYTIMNVVAPIFKALSGTQDMESLISLIGHAGGFAGGVWLCFYIPKERKRTDAEWKQWEEIEDNQNEDYPAEL